MNSVFDKISPIILASKSPRRAQLLEQIGVDFRVIVSHIPENHDNGIPPKDVAMKLSEAKAKSVAQTLDQGLVIGADTIVVLDGKILGKPADHKEAETMLKRLSGKTHQVFTGFTLLDAGNGRKIIDYERTDVTFRDLNSAEIKHYITLEQPFDKAGAYGIQDRSALFVEKIDGCYYNVVGFPLTKFYMRLKNLVEIKG